MSSATKGSKCTRRASQKEEYTRLVRTTVESKATKTQEYQRNELYIPKAFNNKKKRNFEATQCYEFFNSSTAKKLRIKDTNCILCAPTGTFSIYDVKPDN